MTNYSYNFEQMSDYYRYFLEQPKASSNDFLMNIIHIFNIYLSFRNIH